MNIIVVFTENVRYWKSKPHVNYGLDTQKDEQTTTSEKSPRVMDPGIRLVAIIVKKSWYFPSQDSRGSRGEFLGTLAGRWQMFLGLDRRSHLLRQEGTETRTIGIVNSDILSPVGNVVGTLFSHSAGHTGHEPRVAVLLFVFLWNGIACKRVICLDGMLDVVASRQGFYAQNVIEVEAFVTRDGSYEQRNNKNAQ